MVRLGSKPQLPYVLTVSGFNWTGRTSMQYTGYIIYIFRAGWDPQPQARAHKNRPKSTASDLAGVDVLQKPGLFLREMNTHTWRRSQRSWGRWSTCCPAAALHPWGEPASQLQNSHCFPSTLQISQDCFGAHPNWNHVGKGILRKEGQLTQCKSNIVTLLYFSKVLCLLLWISGDDNSIQLVGCFEDYFK